MKFIITSIFFVFLSLNTFAQIKISGTKEVKTDNPKQVEFVRKEVEITKTTIEENTVPTSNALDPIEETEKNPINVVVETPNDASSSTNVNTSTQSTNPKQIVVDLNSSSTTTSSSKNVSSPSSESQKKQETEMISHESASPNSCDVKELNSWALGIQTGFAYIQGDVRAKSGFGASLSVQKGFSKRFSIRYQGIYAQVYGQDWKLKPSQSSYLNYKTRISDQSIQALVSLNKKHSNRYVVQFIAGAGFSTKISWTNSFDENGNVYDYSTVIPPTTIREKGEVLESISAIQDKGYETIISADQLSSHIKNTEINPSIILGLGVNVKLSDRLALGLEHRVSWHNTDNLDNFESNSNDLFHYSSVGLQFTLGKNEQALWWKNKETKCCATNNVTNSKAPTTNLTVSEKPKEEVTVEVSKPIVDEVIYIESNIIGYIFFDANSSKIKEEYYSELYKLNLLFEQDPNIKIQIIGHVDNKGSEFGNKTIARERANSLYHFLTGILKMDPSKFEISSVSENNFSVPEGFEVNAKNQSQMNRSITLIYK
jgi:outer membrane protein OmpA-like peptidoglycan-associated protein